jgi:hypothetical protein
VAYLSPNPFPFWEGEPERKVADHRGFPGVFFHCGCPFHFL